MKTHEKYENRKKEINNAIDLYEYYYDKDQGYLDSHNEGIADRINEIRAEKAKYEKDKIKESFDSSDEGDETDSD